MEYVAQVFEVVNDKKREIQGLKLIWEPEIKGIRHFLAKLEPIK